MTSPAISFATPSAQGSSSSSPRNVVPDDPFDRPGPGVAFSSRPRDKPSPPLPPHIPIHRTTSSGTTDRPRHMAKSSIPNLRRQGSGSSPGTSVTPPPSGIANKDHNVFGRVVRKLSKRVKPPGQREGEASTSSRGRGEPQEYPADRDAHRRAKSRENMKFDAAAHRPPSFEWGPPPLQVGDWVKASGIEVAQPPKGEPSGGKHFAVASRSFDSLVSMTGNDGTTPVLKSGAPEALNPFVSSSSSSPAEESEHTRPLGSGMSPSITSPSLTSLTTPPRYTSKAPVSPPFDPKKVKISSTARGKPASEIPLASVYAPHIVGGRASSKADLRSASGPAGTTPSPTKEVTSPVWDGESEREALIGKGPYWAVQRGWTKGVVTSREEADRRTKNFPGPVIRYFAEDQVDEAIAFVQAGAIPIRPVSGMDDVGGEDVEAERMRKLDAAGYFVPSPSSSSNGLGRSVSLLEKRTQPSHRAAESKLRHNAKGALQGRSLGGETVSSSSSVENGSFSNGQGRTKGATGRSIVTSNLLHSYTPDLSPVIGTAVEPLGDFSFGRRDDRSALARLFAVTCIEGEAEVQSPNSRYSNPTGLMSLLSVHDLDSSIDFYKRILGFSLINRHGKDQALLALPSHKSATICLRRRVGHTDATLLANISHAPALSGSQVLIPFNLPSNTTSAPYSLLRAVKNDFERLLRSDGTADYSSHFSSATATLGLSTWGQARILPNSTSTEGIERKSWGATELALVDPDGHLLILSVSSTSTSPSASYSSSSSAGSAAGGSGMNVSRKAPSVIGSAAPPPPPPSSYSATRGHHQKTHQANGSLSSNSKTYPVGQDVTSSATGGERQRRARGEREKDEEDEDSPPPPPVPQSGKPDFSQRRPQWTLIRDEDEDED